MMNAVSNAIPGAVPAAVPQRCVIVVDSELPVGRAANAAAVIALTVGQRHPGLVGLPLVDASGYAHPGLIPVGIAVLAAPQEALGSLRGKGLEAGCDVVGFPAEGQRTTDYQAFRAAVGQVPTQAMQYVGIALVGDKKPVGKIVANLGLLK
ncbi:DUF2000 domain-containing protein [Cupriavidus sp. 30B13]|uniref:DUF2000 domain-containing protein n=1 Tax=Cupriavidus sp. 30B13 TaxID=3384241 RepID=UPI003B8EDC69